MNYLAVIVEVIKIGIAINDTLSQKGNDITDELNKQTQLLQKISKQIVQINEGINVILSNLVELEHWLRYEAPQFYYDETIKNKLFAEFEKYDKVIFSYLYDRKNLGEKKAFKFNKDFLVNALNSIQDVRFSLLSQKNIFIIPLVARCFAIEVNLMIILYKKVIQKGTIIGSFLGYRNWINDLNDPNQSYSLDFLINKIKNLMDIEYEKLYGFSMCKISEVLDQEIERDAFGYRIEDTYTVDVKFYRFQKQFDAEIEKIIKEQGLTVENYVEILKDLKIPLEYLPGIASQTVSNVYKQENRIIKQIEDNQFPIPKDGDPGYKIKYFQNLPDIEGASKYVQKLQGCPIFQTEILNTPIFFESNSRYKLLGIQLLIPIIKSKILMDIKRRMEYLEKRL